MTKNLPELPDDVELRGDQERPNEMSDPDTGITTLYAIYRVEVFLVTIRWEIGHPFGSFREPNELTIRFEEESYADRFGQGNNEVSRDSLAPGGITTKILRKIPMAHARAFMRERYEHLSVASVRREITPLPSRVETEKDYVHVASAYVALCSTSVEPVQRLAEWTGESPDTWLARLRRARAKGILEGTGQLSRIAAAFTEQSNAIWREMRARSSANGD